MTRSYEGVRVESKVVVHALGGHIIKGVTQDFRPGRTRFHVLPAEGGGVPRPVQLEDIKALFFVKDFQGDSDYDPPPDFGPAPDRGRRCIVTFEDGEVILGSTPDYEEGAAGFTLYPSDPADNNERIYVSRRAVTSIDFP
jgi:hypothetical protein